MHCGYMHRGHMHRGHMHRGHMHRGHMHHGCMHHQQSESQIHALWTPSWTHLRGSHGLSARRARRTKSSRPEGPKAGPKGRKLEVGPRRGPRLLVLYIFIFPCLLILAFIFSSNCGHIFLYSLYFHISMSSYIGFHIFLKLWPNITHSSGNMLLKVLQCRRFQILMNLNENLLP